VEIQASKIIKLPHSPMMFTERAMGNFDRLGLFFSSTHPIQAVLRRSPLIRFADCARKTGLRHAAGL